MSLPALAGLAWATSVALTEKPLPPGTPGTWSQTGDATMDRSGHSARRLDNSQLLVADDCSDSACITG